MTSPSSKPMRRRSRSTRVLVAGMSLVLAASAVAAAALSGSWLLATIAAVTAVVLGAIATRLTNTELAATRREVACERAAQAQAYRELTETRTAEQAVFVVDMTGRIARHQSTISRLEGRLTDATQAVIEAHRSLTAQTRRAERAEDESKRLGIRLAESEERAADAVVRVAELDQELDLATAEWRALDAEKARRRA